MGCDVYANGNEIACKAGGNKVIAEFPDVCLSPPSPPAGPVPIPYPDSSFSKDMQSGSKTVSIKDQEVMLKDQSFYKTSPLGDEAATNGLGANVITHVITGKTYFVAWSMDVQFEGQNVDRHLDLVTSNHASHPDGTPPSGPSLGVMATSTPPCAHEWEIRDPEKEYTADQKIKRLEAGTPGDVFEAVAAKHNKVTDGRNLSGPNKQSKLFQYCKKCNLRGSEVDHVERDSDGKITKTVEVKSGRCQIDKDQLAHAQKVAGDLGATHGYKLQQGPSAELAKKVLLENGIAAANITII